MSRFDKINAHISENLEHHGHYLIDPHAAEDEKIAETVDILIQFVRPERREAVRTQIIDILRREADTAEDR
jgi:endonuclease IV